MYMTSESPCMHKQNNLFPAIRFNLVNKLILLFKIVDSEQFSIKLKNFIGVSKFTVN